MFSQSAVSAVFAMTPGSFSFHRLERLSLKRESEKVIESGRRAARGGFVLYWCDQAESGSELSRAHRPSRRISIRISRDFGSAPRRNRAKRIVREIFRVEKHRLRESIDIVVKIRPLANPEDLRLQVLRPRFLELCETAGILNGSAA